MKLSSLFKKGSVALGAILLLLLTGMPLTYAQDAASLQAHHTSLREKLARNQFQRPLHLESRESSGYLGGSVYAEVDTPFDAAGPALQKLANWCDILILHQNVKQCLTSTTKSGDMLTVNLGRKHEQHVSHSYPVKFHYTVLVARSDYMRVMLHAEKGPMSTKDYRILLEAIPIDGKRSFMHLTYSYSYGTAAKLAMKGYLATIGNDKVGFTVSKRMSNGNVVYVDGMRGVVERNTMRYYLAIDAFLGSRLVPAAMQTEKRLNDWYTGSERYSRQLHELDRAEYLTMKRKEIHRQRTSQSVPASL